MVEISADSLEYFIKHPGVSSLLLLYLPLLYNTILDKFLAHIYAQMILDEDG